MDVLNLRSALLCGASTLLCPAALAAPRGADACPKLFAPAADVATTDGALHVERTEVGIDLVTSNPRWAGPTRAALHGLEARLRRSDGQRERAGRRTAIVHVGEPLHGLCPPGDYEVHVGDAIYETARVLAVIREGMIVEHEDALLFVPFLDRAPPPFRLIWHSTYRMLMPQPAGPAPKPAKPAKPAKKR